MNTFTKFATSLAVAAALFVMGCVSNSTSTPVITPVVTTNSSGIVATNYTTNTVTVTTSVVNTNLVVAIEGLAVSTGTQLGVQAFLKSNPKDTSYVQLISAGLNLALNNGTFNSTNGAAALKATLTQALGANPPAEVLSLVNDLVALYSGSEAVIVSNKINANIFVQTGVSAVASGINTALGQ